MTLELRLYTDWRWRRIHDRAGSAVWVGPLAIYWWRDPAGSGSREIEPG